MTFVDKAKVVEIIKHDENTIEIVFSVKNREYNPGSFAQLSLEDVTASDIWPESRTFSIASFEKGLLKFIIKNVGVYTKKIFEEIEIGKICTIKYPFGNLFDNNISNKHILIAGGIGVTPFLGLVDYFKSIDQINKIHLLYSVKFYKDLLYYEKLKKELGDNLIIFITRERFNGFQNRRIEFQDIYKIAELDSSIYICGSKLFINYFKEILKSKGYTKIYIDEWE